MSRVSELFKTERPVDPLALEILRRALVFQEMNYRQLVTVVSETARCNPKQAERIVQIRDQIISNISYLDPADQFSVVLAHDFGLVAHGEQKRDDGSVYFEHPQWCLQRLAHLQLLDSDTLATAVLHDVTEDTPVTLKGIRSVFGNNISRLTDSLSKTHTKQKSLREARTTEKLIFGMLRDPRVLLIKVGADRLHNLLTPKNADYLKVTAEQTLDIFIPLLNEFGVEGIEDDLTRICLTALSPNFVKHYEEIKAIYSQRDLNPFSCEVNDCLSGDSPFLTNFPLFSDIRFPSLYEVYVKTEGDPGKIFEFLRPQMRIVYLSKDQAALGALRLTRSGLSIAEDESADLNHFGREENEYIKLSLPQHNSPLDVMVTTEDYVQQRERLLYLACSERPSLYVQKTVRRKLDKIHGFVDSLVKQHTNPFRRLDAFKEGYHRPQVVVITPLGEEVRLDAGATILDLAARIHSDFLFTCVGAKYPEDDRVTFAINDVIYTNYSVINLVINNEATIDVNRFDYLTTSYARDQFFRRIDQILHNPQHPLFETVSDQVKKRGIKILSSGLGGLVDNNRLPFIPNAQAQQIILDEYIHLRRIQHPKEGMLRVLRDTAIRRSDTRVIKQYIDEYSLKTLAHFSERLISIPIINDAPGILNIAASVLSDKHINLDDNRQVGSTAERNYCLHLLVGKLPKGLLLSQLAQEIDDKLHPRIRDGFSSAVIGKVTYGLTNE